MSIRPVYGPEEELAIARWEIAHCRERLAHWTTAKARYWADPDFALQLVMDAQRQGHDWFDIGTVGGQVKEYALRLREATVDAARLVVVVRLEQRRRWLLPRSLRPRRDGRGRVRSRRVRTPRCARAPARPDDDPEPEPDLDPPAAA